MENICLEKTLEIIHKRGYETRTIATNKFSEPDIGISILKSGFTPVFYWNNTPIEEDIETEEEMAEFLIKWHNKWKDAAPYDENLFNDKEELKTKLRVAIMPTVKCDNSIARPSMFEGISEYIYLDINEECDAKVNKTMLDMFDMTEDELWKVARNNSINEVVIQSLGSLFGVDEEDAVEIYMVSNTTNHKGAASILFESVRDELFDIFKKNRLTILPSSIHEVLVCKEMVKEAADAMVKDANETVVLPTDVLANESFIITR